MIIDIIINIFLDLGIVFLNSLDKISIEIPATVFSVLEGVFTSFGNIVPVKALLPILYISIVIKTVEITWSIFLRIKSFVPMWGN